MNDADEAAPAPSPLETEWQLALFQSTSGYVYRIPPATTVGHRAETWNVDRWIQEVGVKVVRLLNDEARIMLSDLTTGELFAECPITLPLQTCLETVVDSSRYFVLRIVDRESGHHAFVGLGFRERLVASDFSAALYEHVHYLEKKAAAAEMRRVHEARQQQRVDARQGGGEAAATAATAGPPSFNYSLRPGETLQLRINPRREGGGRLDRLSGSKLTKTFSLVLDHVNGASMEAAFAPAPAHTEAAPAMESGRKEEKGPG